MTKVLSLSFGVLFFLDNLAYLSQIITHQPPRPEKQRVMARKMEL